MASPDLPIWLQERTALGILSPDILSGIAEVIKEQVVPANHHLVIEDTLPEALYILKRGQLESEHTSQTNLSPCGFLPGAVINLQELLLNQPTQQTIITLSECHLWVVSKAKFQQLVAKYPEITQTFSQQLAQELAQLSSQLTYEQERQAALRPYFVTKAKRGVVGASRYAVRLRQQIRQAAQDMQPVLVFGEPGLEKDNLSALIHFSSQKRREPITQILCGLLQTSGADLFGRAGGKPGLLEWLGEGTLVLNNIQDLPAELVPKIAQLLETGNYTPVNRPGEPPAQPRASNARIMMIAEKAYP